MDAKKEELVRFLNYLQEDRKLYWSFICDDGLDMKTCKEVIERLVDKEFYLLIPAVIGRTKSLEIEDLVHKFCLRALAEYCSSRTMEEIADEFRRLLDEITIKNNEERKVTE